MDIYLPLDGPYRKKVPGITILLVIFVKYEFWYYYLKKISYRNIPLLLISALFRKDMSFFKWYGGLQQKMLLRFNQLFVQNRTSLELLQGIGLGGNSRIAGDTRFDRVKQIAEHADPLPLIEKFLGTKACIVAGSTWPEDEEVLINGWKNLEMPELKWIIAPHEISAKHLQQLKQRFTGAILYSELLSDPSLDNQVLIIDNVGMLSRLYRYSRISYVGGGFIKWAHNVLSQRSIISRWSLVPIIKNTRKRSVWLLKVGVW